MRSAWKSFPRLHQIIHREYGKSESDRAVPKREQEWEAVDILWVFKFFRVEDEALDSGDNFDDATALTALTTFSHVDKHYTYTLPQEPDQVVDQEGGENGSMCDVLIGVVSAKNQATEI